MSKSVWAMVVIVVAALGACAGSPGEASQIQRLATALASRPIALLGEVHDNAGQHALRAAALRVLLDGGARPALLFEQFDRERQRDLDQALARAGVTADEVIAAGAPAGKAPSGWDWALYRPYIALALEYRLPIVAVNVSRADARRVVDVGLAALGFDASVPGDIESAQQQAIVAGHCGMLDAVQALRLVRAQVARDQLMARAIETHAARGALLLAGNGHVRRDIGVPRWLGATTRARSVSIGLLEKGDADAARYDIAFTTPSQSRPDPCGSLRERAPKR